MAVKGMLSTQQRDVLTELARREDLGWGAQSAMDFADFKPQTAWGPRSVSMGYDSANAVFKRLANRGLVDCVSTRPNTYRLTDDGRAARAQ